MTIELKGLTTQDLEPFFKLKYQLEKLEAEYKEWEALLKPEIEKIGCAYSSELGTIILKSTRVENKIDPKELVKLISMDKFLNCVKVNITSLNADKEIDRAAIDKITMKEPTKPSLKVVPNPVYFASK